MLRSRRSSGSRRRALNVLQLRGWCDSRYASPTPRTWACQLSGPVQFLISLLLDCGTQQERPSRPQRSLGESCVGTTRRLEATFWRQRLPVAGSRGMDALASNGIVRGDALSPHGRNALSLLASAGAFPVRLAISQTSHDYALRGGVGRCCHVAGRRTLRRSSLRWLAGIALPGVSPAAWHSRVLVIPRPGCPGTVEDGRKGEGDQCRTTGAGSADGGYCGTVIRQSTWDGG
ncbi:hypothetical protein EJ06DRAFT_265262 [Trichodelitschia bisporula]|uniref:Uncharacterized protein n=1 Tax=Trichodelitschia bisporula TaxID=703511 RepID=A0A6G1HHY6_9PEZI|nr:hypothetical protein EJ06DRAFT_265262 [Trichodelitschia bisporula]